MSNESLDVSRRQYLGLFGGAAALGAIGVACQESTAQAAHAASTTLPPAVELPEWLAASERQTTKMPRTMPPDQRVGVALVGLGRLTLEQIIPAIARSKYVKVTALVSRDPQKAKNVGAQLGVPPERQYTPATFDSLKDAKDVDFVYIVTPNANHKEFVVRAAKAGKHVLCEKPMATTTQDAEEMIKACQDAKRLLMIAYRMQYTPLHLELQRRLRAGELGAPKIILAHNGQSEGHEPSDWRLKKDIAGGGALPDVGIYCLNAARYLTGEEPVEVRATMVSTPGDARFAEVEEAMFFTLRFPGGVVAHCSTSYGSHESRSLQVLGADGWAKLDPAFSYRGLRLQIGKKAKGQNLEEVTDVRMEETDQFAVEIDHFAECVTRGRTPRTPGEEGLQDMKLMAAIYRSAREGRAVQLDPVAGKDAFRGPALEPADK